MDLFNTDSLALFLAQEAPKKGLPIPGGWLGLVIIVVVIAGGIYWYRSRGAK
jgi:hypothetical protein